MLLEVAAARRQRKDEQHRPEDLVVARHLSPSMAPSME
jgi:hypothetical protein